jgi:hypothetical protein
MDRGLLLGAGVDDLPGGSALGFLLDARRLSAGVPLLGNPMMIASFIVDDLVRTDARLGPRV